MRLRFWTACLSVELDSASTNTHEHEGRIQQVPRMNFILQSHPRQERAYDTALTFTLLFGCSGFKAGLFVMESSVEPLI